MKTIILAASNQSRLFPATKEVAKPLLTIRGKPAIEHVIGKVKLLPDSDEIIIVTSHKLYKHIKSCADNYASPIPIKIIDDGSVNGKDRLGPIRDLALVLSKENIDDDVLVVGADNLFSFTLDEFLICANSVRPHNVIGVYNLNGRFKPGKFGVVKVDENKKVIDFIEKSSQRNGLSLVSMCLYFFPKEKIPLIKEYLKDKKDSVTAGDYIQWLTDKDTVYGYTFIEGDWFDIGDAESYAEAVFNF